MAELTDEIISYSRYLEKYLTRTPDNNKLFRVLKKLDKLSITLQHLQDTGIGKVVNHYRKHEGELGQKARELVLKWKNLVPQMTNHTEHSGATLQCETISETPYRDTPERKIHQRAPYMHEISPENSRSKPSAKSEVSDKSDRHKLHSDQAEKHRCDKVKSEPADLEEESHDVEEKEANLSHRRSDKHSDEVYKRDREHGRKSNKSEDRNHRRKNDKERGHNSKEDQGHSSKEDRGRSSSDDRGHSSKKDRGHSSKEDRGHSSKEDRGQRSKEDRGHSSKEDRGRSGKEDRGRSGKDDRGHSSKVDRGRSGKEDRSHSSKEDRGHSSKEDRGHSSKEDRGRSGKDDRGHSSKEDRSRSSKEQRGHSSKQDRGHSSQDDRGHSDKDDRGHSSKEQKSRSEDEKINKKKESKSHDKKDGKYDKIKNESSARIKIDQGHDRKVKDHGSEEDKDKKDPSAGKHCKSDDLSMDMDQEILNSLETDLLDQSTKCRDRIETIQGKSSQVKTQMAGPSEAKDESQDEDDDMNDHGGMSFEDFLTYDHSAVAKKRKANSQKLPTSSKLKKGEHSSKGKTSSKKQEMIPNKQTNKHSGDKQRKHSGDKHAKHSGDKHAKHSGDKHAKHSGDKKGDHKHSSDRHGKHSKKKDEEVSSSRRAQESKASGSRSKSDLLSTKDSGSSAGKRKPDMADLLLTPPPQKRIHLTPEDMEDLPIPSSSYKPLPRLREFDNQPTTTKALKTEDEDLGNKTYSRTQIYSGRRVNHLTAVPRLYDICMRILIDNIDALGETGVPYDILKPVLEVCTPVQLYNLEELNPQWDETDGLWKKHAQRDFRGCQPDEFESWRELYLRKFDERQVKLKSLTANISATVMKSKDATRKTKLAYVDIQAKPPRSVRRQQERHGTAGPIKKDPLSRLTSHGGLPSTPQALLHPSSTIPDQRRKKETKPVAPMMAKTLKLMKSMKR